MRSFFVITFTINNFWINLLSLLPFFLSYKYNNGFRNTRSVTILEKTVDSEVTKPKRGRKKKADTKINELEENDIRDKRERLVCVFYLVTQKFT